MLIPLASDANPCLPLAIQYHAFADALAPALCLVDTLAQEVSGLNPEQTETYLARFDEVTQQAQIY